MKIPIIFLTVIIMSFANCKGQAIEDVNAQSGAIAPSGSYEPYFIDTISADSGNVIVSIPLRTFKQRGGNDVNVSLTYHAKSWVGVLNTDIADGVDPYWVFANSTTDPYASYTAYGGVALTSNLYFPESTQPISTGTLNPGVVNNPAYWVQSGVSSPDGGMHWLLPRSDGLLVSMDGAGYVAGTASGECPGVFSRDGICHNDPNNIFTGFSPTLWQDSNGNQITVTNINNPNVNGAYDNVTVKDTVGRLLQMPLVYPFAGNETSDFSSCTGTLPIVEARTISWPSENGNATYKLCYATVELTTNFHAYGAGYPLPEAEGVPVRMLQSVVLPDDSAWTFEYQDRDPADSSSINYGELTKITLPTGGYISYTWSSAPILCQSSANVFSPQGRTLVQRVEDDQDGNGPKTWTYSYSVTPTSVTTPHTLTTTIKGPAPAYDEEIDSFREVDYGENPYGCYYQMSQVQQVDGPSGKTLKTVSRQSGDYRKLGGDFGDDVNNSFYETTYLPIRTTTTLDNGETTKTEIDYDPGIQVTIPGSGNDAGLVFDSFTAPYGSTMATRTYDYGSNAPGALLSQTINTYYWQTNDSYAQAGMFDIPQSVIIQDGNKTHYAETDYVYDVSTQSTSGLPQHVAPFHSVRGNLSSVAQWISSSGNTINTSTIYDDAGMLLSSTGPNGKTGYDYDSTDTFISNLTPPTPSSGVTLTTTFQYDANSGALNNSTDPNGTQTVYKNYDGFGRPQEVDVLDSGNNTVNKNIYYWYNQTSYTVTPYQNSSVSGNIGFQLDGDGRPSRQAINNGQSTNPWYQQDTCYDTNGNMSFKSYRYQGDAWSTPKVCSGSGDTYSHDALKRITKITHADGTSINYSYIGRATQIVDESGVTKIYQIDGLGRTTIVCEVTAGTGLVGSVTTPSSCGTDIAGTGFVTNYYYSLANHTMTISQGAGAQQRAFGTDWLGRTIFTQEPERGQTSYSYSYNNTGLVITRQKPKANQTNASVLTTTTTQYDALGRVLSVSYTDGTAPKNFYYDAPVGWSGYSQNNSVKGRLSYAVMTPVGATYGITTAYIYSPTGQVTGLGECTPATCGVGAYNLTYTYDWLGNLKSSTDASGMQTSYTYTVANEATLISSNPHDTTHPGTLITNVQNGPNGPLSYQFGNGVWQSYSYDTLGRRNGGWTCRNSSQNSCTGGTQLYGWFATWQGSRLTSSADTSLGQGASYGYDDFNRLTSRTITTGAAQNYTYNYDVYGNRWAQNALNGGNQSNLSFNEATNQVNSSGAGYDAAGNMLVDGTGNQYTYDAEGNVIQEVTPSGTVKNTYNALNQQIRTDFPAYNVATENVFTAAGQLDTVWEVGTGRIIGKAYWGSTPFESYDTGTNLAYFQHRDWNGSERLITNASATVTDVQVSLPFGDGFANTSGARDNTFDGYDGYWDGATNITNHTQFREYANNQGRWLQPDPYSGSYDFSNPQSFNRYAFVLNNPLGFADPLGLALQYDCSPSDPDFNTEVSDAKGDITDTVHGGTTKCTVYDDGSGHLNTFIPFRIHQGFTTAPNKPSCPPLPAHPDWGESFQKDIDMLNSQNPAFRLITFKQEVQTGGPWDYKDQVPGMQQVWADFGNFHYGYVGAGAHIPEGLLRWAAGAANWHDNPQNRPLYGSPFDPRNPIHGDQPNDQAQIQAGINAYRAGCQY